MAGTRRGNDRKQQSDAFEAANPFLTRVDYEIEVIRDDPFPHFGGGIGAQNIQQIALLEEDLDPLIPLVTEDGMMVESLPLGLFDPGVETSFMDALLTPAGTFFSFDPEVDEANTPPFGGDESIIVMTDYGFGVTSEDEFFDSIEALDEEEFEGENGFPDLPPENFALDDDEQLVFFVALEEAPVPLTGAYRVEIDYMAVGGSGEVVVEYFDFFDFEDDMGTVSSGPVSAGDSGQVEYSGFMNAFAIGVTGSLEVIVNTVGFTTNFVGSPVELTSE